MKGGIIMNTKTMKILTTVLTILVLIAMGTSVFAITPDEITADTNVTGQTEITTMGKKIVGIIQTVGVVLAVVILMVLGIKYMMGSAEEKADYKKTMIPYIVGAVLIFGASTVANVIYNLATGINA